MAYENNFPNGYKDGYSSADDPDRVDYSPYGVERAHREALQRSEERERVMSEYNARLEREKALEEKQQAEMAKEEWQKSQWEREGREQVAQRRKAINFIVQQKRDEYNKKSWFGKAVATLRGKSFDKMKREVIADAERRVDRMSADQLERFVENQIEGRQR